MADLDITKRAQPVELFDETTGLSASIVLDGGVPKLRSLSDVTVNSLRGFDPIADTWGFIGTEANSTGVGAAGDTIRTQIAAGDDVSLFPAVDVSTTVQVGDTEEILADRHVSELNGDSNFSLRYSARRINKRAVTVYITAKEAGPQGERPNINDYQFTATGTTVVTPAFQNIIRRQKDTSLARDPSDPTLGVIGISGSVSATAGDVTGRFVEFFLNGGSSSLLVDGSVTPVDFTVTSDAVDVKFIRSIRFAATGNGIKFGQFLSKSGAGGLTNGIEVTIRSNNAEFTFAPIKTTENFLNGFAIGEDNFNLFIQAGGDQMRATLTFLAPFELQKTGTFATDDFLRVRIRDNITAGISMLDCRAFGFKREF